MEWEAGRRESHMAQRRKEQASEYICLNQLTKQVKKGDVHLLIWMEAEEMRL